MLLSVALQMDPLEDVNIDGDSSFVLGLEAQKRGYRLYHYLAETLSWDRGQVSAEMAEITLRREKGNHFTAGERIRKNLKDLDVVLMRQDPPFDMQYITYTHFLEQVHPKPFVVNHPASVRNAPEKLFVLDFLDLMPETLITRSEAEVRAFQASVGDVVIKPLFGNGGVGVFHVEQGSPNLSSLMEMFTHQSREPVMVQKFLPRVTEGDKRIVLVDGEVAGAINRIPAKGEIRSNLVVGGNAVQSTLTKREEEICARLKPVLKARDLIFVGIDVIDGWLTEINVTSPTGLQSINAFDHVCLEADIWDAIERRIQ